MRQSKGWYSRGYLPHFDAADTVQAITFRLADSLPAAMLQRIALDPGLDEAVRRRRTAELLDRGLGACFLRDPRVGRLVDDALLAFDGERYRLLAWVVMPNHVHAVIETVHGHPLPGIVKSWKAFTAAKANALLNRRGRFWQPDYFDRYIRNERHLAAALHYVEANPVRAGLVPTPSDWPHGSAARRHTFVESGPAPRPLEFP